MKSGKALPLSLTHSHSPSHATICVNYRVGHKDISIRDMQTIDNQKKNTPSLPAGATNGFDYPEY